MSTLLADAAPAVRERPRRARRSRGTAVALALVTTALLAALAGGAYLWVVADRWQQRAGELDAARAASAEQARAQAAHAQDLQAQLEQATERVRALSDEKAQAGDQQAVSAQEAAASDATARSAASAATATASCANALRSLLELVLPGDGYDVERARELATTADARCASAQSSQDDLTTALGSG